MKRTIDVIVGFALSVLTFPFVVALALFTAVRLRTRPIFLQPRVGRHGQPFTMPKIRTLPRSFPRNALKTNHDIGSATLPVLRRVRAMHLDELPQLWLTVLGTMSLVGPRPKLLDQHEPVDCVYATLRTRVRPGCTGLWQISVHRDALPNSHPEYDFAYLRWQCGRLDAWICWRTVRWLLGLGTQIELRDVPRWARGRGIGLDGCDRHVVVDVVDRALGCSTSTDPTTTRARFDVDGNISS